MYDEEIMHLEKQCENQDVNMIVYYAKKFLTHFKVNLTVIQGCLVWVLQEREALN